MKWSMKQILDSENQQLLFSETLDVKNALITRESEIMDVSLAKVSGRLLYDNHSVIAIFSIDVILTLPSSRTLEPVNVPLTIAVQERYVESGYLSQYMTDHKDDVILPLDNGVLDLTESVEDSILLHLPIQVLSQEDQASQDFPKGQGWELFTEDAYRVKKQQEKENTIDPRFAALTNLLQDDSQD